MAAVVVEGMDGDAEASGVGGAGLAAGGEFLGEIEELLTGAEGALHPYTSAHGGGRGKAGVSRSDTIQDSAFGTVPRLAAFLLALFVFLPWMLYRITEYAVSILGHLEKYAG